MKIDLELIQAEIIKQSEMIAEIHRMLSAKEPTVDYEKPMSIKEASEFLGISVAAIYSSKNIPRKKRGGHLFFFKSELLNYVNS